MEKYHSFSENDETVKRILVENVSADWKVTVMINQKWLLS